MLNAQLHTNDENALLEFLEDCAAVRLHFGYDYAEHRALLDELIAVGSVPASMQNVASNLMKALSLERPNHPLTPDAGTEMTRTALSEVQRLSQKLSRPRHIYHGTTAGKLEGISRLGLMPGSKSPWRGDEAVERQCSEHTFFTVTWTTAITFAQVAHYRSRGPKAGWARSPVVLRLPADGLALERDPLVSQPDCWMVPGGVSAASAQVRLSPFAGISKWKSIEEAGRRPAVARLT